MTNTERGAAIRAKRHAHRIHVIDVAIRARVTTRDVLAAEEGRGTDSEITAIESATDWLTTSSRLGILT